MSVLLTDEAVRAADRAHEAQLAELFRAKRPHEPVQSMYGPGRAMLEAVLRYHATEGREALVDRVFLYFQGAFPFHPESEKYTREKADRLVTALFGEAA